MPEEQFTEHICDSRIQVRMVKPVPGVGYYHPTLRRVFPSRKSQDPSPNSQAENTEATTTAIFTVPPQGHSDLWGQQVHHGRTISCSPWALSRSEEINSGTAENR